MRGRAAADRAEPGGYRVRTAARPVDAVPAHRRGGSGQSVSGALAGADARALVHPPRRAFAGTRVLDAAVGDGPAVPALGDRAEQPGGPAPGRAAGLDRAARGHVGGRGGAPGGAGPRQGRSAAVPAGRSRDRPGLRQQAAGSGDRPLRRGTHGPGGPARGRRRRGAAGRTGGAPAGRAPDVAHLVDDVGGDRPAAYPAAGRARGGALDARPLVVHRPPGPRTGR